MVEVGTATGSTILMSLTQYCNVIYSDVLQFFTHFNSKTCPHSKFHQNLFYLTTMKFSVISPHKPLLQQKCANTSRQNSTAIMVPSWQTVYSSSSTYFGWTKRKILRYFTALIFFTPHLHRERFQIQPQRLNHTMQYLQIACLLML